MKTEKAIEALAALAQESRLGIYRLLIRQGPQGLTAGSIAERMEMPGATLSFHLKELAHAGMVTARQDGRFIHYSANYAAMDGLLAYLTENCCCDQARGDCPPQPARPKRAAASTVRRGVSRP